MTSKLVKFAIIIAAALAIPLATPSRALAQETVEYDGLDALGSVRVIFDGQGNVVDRMDYGPFGENLRAAIKFPTASSLRSSPGIRRAGWTTRKPETTRQESGDSIESIQCLAGRGSRSDGTDIPMA